MAHGIYANLYSLVESRSAKIVHDFLARFLPNREESAEEYEVPQYADTPDVVFDNANDLIAYLEHHSHERYNGPHKLDQ